MRFRLPKSVALIALLLAGCGNNPYGEFPDGKVMLLSMGDDPRTLDPVRVGDTSSNSIASNIHDTPFEYHYLKRPLEVKPAMATEMPLYGMRTVNGRLYHTFRFSIKKGLRYMDDACFAGGRGREITIDDMILSIKRAADSSLDPFGSPLLTGKLAGFDEYAARIEKRRAELQGVESERLYRELYAADMEGLRKIDDYTLELLLTERYPQIIYFFVLSVSSPTAIECLARYDGREGRETYDRHPAVSGPFYLKEWHANYRIVLAKNPNYRRDDLYPAEGNPGDEATGLLDRRGERLPLVDEVRFQIIKAGPPVWTLFEQGYLDRAGIPNEVFNQVIQGQDLSDAYRKLGIKLDRDVDVATYWWYFNMSDPLFQHNAKLRRALSLCLDREEMIERFYNGRGVVAHGIVPPGIEGYSESYRNPYSAIDLDQAKRLLTQAGYPDGLDPKTGRPLQVTITLVASQGTTGMYRFFIDQYQKCNVDLKIEQLDWPTVLEKKYKKNFQMIHGGWHADYPDPQNFLQLLYGPNSDGPYNENRYMNPRFDSFYDRIKNMNPGPTRRELISRMNAIVAEDAAMIFLFHPVSFGLSHDWYAPLRPHPINTNQLKFRDIDPERRMATVREWNRPGIAAYAVLIIAIGGMIALAIIGIRQYRRMGR
jgi:ABC-type transport system substrate-binding protein